METQTAETIETAIAVAAESALHGLRAQIEEYLGVVGTELAGYDPAVYTTDPAGQNASGPPSIAALPR